MSEYTIRPLGPETWDAFAALAAKHNGVWGGCWCTWFHTFYADKGHTAEGNRVLKERLVNEGRAHAALVFDGDAVVSWCEYGSPDELPNINHRKGYEAGLRRAADVPPDLLLRGQGLSPQRRRSHGAARGPGPDCAGGRRLGGDVPAGHTGKEDIGVTPV